MVAAHNDGLRAGAGRGARRIGVPVPARVAGVELAQRRRPVLGRGVVHGDGLSLGRRRRDARACEGPGHG